MKAQVWAGPVRSGTQQVLSVIIHLWVIHLFNFVVNQTSTLSFETAINKQCVSAVSLCDKGGC